MLLDIMSSYNSLQLNVKTIKLFGLEAAAYWAIIVDIYPRVVQKKFEDLIQASGYFTVDRQYIEERTSIKPEQQRQFDIAFSRLNVISVYPNQPDTIKVDLQVMHEILLEDDSAALQKYKRAAKLSPTEKAAAKREGIIAAMVAISNAIAETPAVANAFEMWIRANVEGGGKFSTASVKIAAEELNAYTDNPELKVYILKQAAASCWSNVKWVIDKLPRTTTFLNQPQKTCTAVDTDVAF